MNEELGEVKHIRLNNGLDLFLEDEEELFISVRDEENEIKRVNIPYPRSGYGGGSILVSPSQNYLVFSYYSGQSQEAFKLYLISGEIVKLYDSGYSFGEVASFCFDKEENLLVMVLYFSCEWWLTWEDGDIEEDNDGNNYLSLGEIRMLNLSNKLISNHEIMLEIPTDWEPSVEEYNPFVVPRVIGNEIELSMPWGIEKLQLPLNEHIKLSPSLRTNKSI